ncbi:MAG: type VI secretion system contractile sheath large subunit [Blastocatellia bacterium]|nr:type VI secretion system contractile sheath large subunit [Blastocatellia bacterium]
MDPNESHLNAEVVMGGESGNVIDEPPFHILFLGNWSGDGSKTAVAERRRIEIDRDNFDETIAKLDVRLNLEFEGGRSLDLEFSELEDFHPDQLFRRVSAFGELRDLRRRLNSESTFGSASREAKAMFEISESRYDAGEVRESAPLADNLLDAILSGGAGEKNPAGSHVSADLNKLVEGLVRPHLVSIDEGDQAQLLAAVDQATSELMREILHNKRFQELEAAWRGLYFLVRRTETSSDLKIFIFDLSKDELLEDLRSAESLNETMSFRNLVAKPIQDGEPYAALFANYAFAPEVDDIAALMRISAIAAAGTSPFISHMRPDVLGVRSLSENPDAKLWGISPDTAVGKSWQTLQLQADAESLGMVIPRFLVRLPYGSDTDPAECFDFEEFDGVPTHDDYCWANGSFVAAHLLAETFSRSGWDMSRTFVQDVERLPVHVYQDGTESIYKPCAEILMTQEGAERLMKFGLMPLISYKNTDRIKLGRFQSVADTALKGRWR